MQHIKLEISHASKGCSRLTKQDAQGMKATKNLGAGGEIGLFAPLATSFMIQNPYK